MTARQDIAPVAVVVARPLVQGVDKAVGAFRGAKAPDSVMLVLRLERY
jgi:hypothetical protein